MESANMIVDGDGQEKSDLKFAVMVVPVYAAQKQTNKEINQVVCKQRRLIRFAHRFRRYDATPSFVKRKKTWPWRHSAIFLLLYRKPKHCRKLYRKAVYDTS